MKRQITDSISENLTDSDLESGFSSLWILLKNTKMLVTIYDSFDVSITIALIVPNYRRERRESN